MPIELRHLRALVLVAQTSSFTRAAGRLGMTPSAVSQLVRTLEGEVGEPLLTRTTRSVSLTAAGADLVARVSPALEAVDSALATARDNGRSRAPLRVGFKAGGTGGLLTEVLHAYSAAHPQVQVELRRMDWTDDLQPLSLGTLDAALARPPLDTTGLAVRTLLSDRRVVELPTWHRLAGRSEISLTDIADEPVITGAGAPAALNDFWTVNPRPDGSAPRPAPAVRNNEEMLVHVALGHGVCIAAGTVAAQHAPDVVFRPITDLPPLPLLLLTATGPQRPAVSAFIDLCTTVADEAKRRTTSPSRQ